MKPLSIILHLSPRMLLLSSGLWIAACQEKPHQPESVEFEANPTVTQQEKLPDESISALERQIQEGRQNIQNIEAFGHMARTTAATAATAAAKTYTNEQKMACSLDAMMNGGECEACQ